MNIIDFYRQLNVIVINIAITNKKRYINLSLIVNPFDKGLHRAMHEMTTACREGKVEQVYITNRLGCSILVDTL
jgi:hypothetical protein